MSQPSIIGDYGSSYSAAAASPPLPAAPPGDGVPQQQQQQPTPGTHDAHHGGPTKMNQLLDANYLGVHTLAVGQVKATEFTRQINARGLNKVKLSIKTKGWVSSNTPYVLVPHEQLPSGKDTVFSFELLRTLIVYCLDGNHRIRALFELEGAEFSVECRLYLHFDCAETINALARSVNGVTGATAETTTYDRIFSTMKAMDAIMASKGINDPSKVTAVMLADAYRKGGDVPPSNVQLCGNKRLVIGFSDEAFAALKTVSESDHPSIDVHCLSKNLLDHQIVTSDLKAHPLEQSFLIHILARFKKHNKKSPLREDLPRLKARVMEAGVLHRQVENVIPQGSWTPDFVKSLTDLMYGKQSEWETWGSGHLRSREEEVDALKDLLPAGCKLSKDHVKTIKGKLPARLDKVVKKSADLRQYVEAWDQEMAAVNTFVDLSKDLPNKSSSSSSSSSDDESVDGDTNKVVLCERCNPSGKTGFCCPKCGMHHLAWCKVAEKPDEEDGAIKERPCVKCPSSQPPSKKRKKNGRPTLPRRDENAELETSMSRNTTVHSEELFVGRTKAYSGGTPLKVNTAPKLAIVDLTRETHLFKNTESSNRSLKVVLQSILEALHPQGTMAFALPRPWLTTGFLVGGAFAGIDNAIVEDHPLLVTYDAVAGGAVKKTQENHFRNQSELVLVVHRPCPPDKPFTCNRRVVVADVFGHSTGRYPHAKQILALESLPAGAPSGGSRSFFPGKVAHFLIGRFTNVTDTVLGIGVETTSVAEEAIQKGRSVEFYVTDDDKRGVLGTRILQAFRTAHSRGMFQSRLGQEAWIGPKVLPSGLPRPTVSPRVTQLLQTAQEQGEGNRFSACFKVPQTIVKDSNYELKDELDRARAELLPKKRRKRVKTEIILNV